MDATISLNLKGVLERKLANNENPKLVIGDSSHRVYSVLSEHLIEEYRVSGGDLKNIISGCRVVAHNLVNLTVV